MRVFLGCALALAVGCGGGGGTTMAAAQLSGTVYEIDGQSTDLAGVQVTLMETGDRLWTDGSGAFVFRGLEPGTYTLDFDTSFAMLQEGDHEDGAEDDHDGVEGDHEDGIDDHEDGVEDHEGDGHEDEPGHEDGDEFEDEDGHPKVDVPEGGDVECHVALENGEVKDFSTGHEEEQYAMAKLHLTDAAEIAGYRVEGGIKIAARGDGTLFKVCVEGLMGGDVIEILVHETSIGTATADGEGRACLVLENDLPLGAPNLGELAGLRVDVYLAETDLRLLVGEVPELMEEDGKDDGDEPGEEDGDKPDGDDGEADGDGDKPDGDGTGEDGEGDGNDDGEEGEEPGDDGEGDGSEGGEDGEGV